MVERILILGNVRLSAELPVTTVPIYLHIQPLLASLPYDSSSKQLTFIITLHDDVHSLKHSTVTQYSPSDWLDVEYEKSDWVEERLVDVLRVGVEVVVQDVSRSVWLIDAHLLIERTGWVSTSPYGWV